MSLVLADQLMTAFAARTGVSSVHFTSGCHKEQLHTQYVFVKPDSCIEVRSH